MLAGLPAAARAQSVELPKTLSVEAGRLGAVAVKYDGDDVKYAVDPQLDAFREYDPDPKVIRLRVQGFREGTYRVIAVAAKGGRLSDFAVCTVTVGKPVPPTPPQPPTPPVPPTPPAPPEPAPIPAEGFRVLTVVETGELSKLAGGQHAALYSKEVRDYLNSRCVVGPDGKTKEWRIWDQHADPSAEQAHWREAMKRPRQSLPWVLVSDGKRGYEGPLPATPEAFLELLKRYGG